MTFKGHGNRDIVERIMPQAEVRENVRGLKKISISGRGARECIDIAYGFFTPLEGFMTRESVNSVCEKMSLPNGVLWPIPIILDVKDEEVRNNRIKEGDTVLLSYTEKPLAILEIEDIFSYDKEKIAKAVLGTTDKKHPGVIMLEKMENTFIGGEVTLVNPPKFQPLR